MLAARGFAPITGAGLAKISQPLLCLFAFRLPQIDAGSPVDKERIEVTRVDLFLLLKNAGGKADRCKWERLDFA